MNRRTLLRNGAVLTAGTALPGVSLTAVSASADAGPTPVELLEALWKAIQDHYPMLEFVGSYGDGWLEEFRPRVTAAKDLNAAYPVLEELVCRLRDYHTRFLWPGRPERMSLPIRGHELREGAEAQVVVRKSAVPEVAAADEVLSVDGVPVREALKEAARFAVGSTPEALSRSAVDRMLSAVRGTEGVLRVRSGADAADREVWLRATGYPDQEPTVGHRALDEKTGYLRIPRWSAPPGENLTARFDQALEAYREAPYLVIDVRDNPGGADGLADSVTGRFLKQRIISSISFHRDTPTLNFKRTVEWCEPRGPWTYEGRVAVLTDEGCASACEHFVSGMIGAKAYLVGMPTNGACGWIRRIDLPGGAILFCSRTFPLHGGTPSPLHGLEPHVRTPLTRADLRSGKDAALEQALRWLRSGDPLPLRQQPV